MAPAPLPRYVSELVCSGYPDCDVTLLSDANCSTPITYTEYGANYTGFIGYIPYYTTIPPVIFEASSCGVSAGSFYYMNGTLVYTTPFVNDPTNGTCIMQNPMTTFSDNLLFIMQLSQIGANETITIKRAQPMNTVFFSRSVVSATVNNNLATIQVDLMPTYSYPYCCRFPDTFVSTSYTFRRTNQITTCGVDDIVTYTLNSSSPTSIQEINSTYYLWTFQISNPVNESCGLISEGNSITDPFTVSILVRNSVVPVVPAFVVKPNAVEITSIVVGVIVPCIVLFLTCACYWVRHQRNRKDNKK